MKKIFLISFICVLMMATNSKSAIVEKYGIPYLSILDFVPVSSSQEEESLVKRVKLKVINNSDKTLYKVKFTLVYSSDQVSIQEGEVYLGTINPGQIITSDDVFIYSIDTNRAKINPEIDLHWKVEYEDENGEQVGEILIKEQRD